VRIPARQRPDHPGDGGNEVNIPELYQRALNQPLRSPDEHMVMRFANTVRLDTLEDVMALIGAGATPDEVTDYLINERRLAMEATK
jgi:hypothetical protein